MASAGLVVDGDFDESAIAELIRRCRPKLGISGRQAGRSIPKAVNILRELDRVKVKSALWITDAENDDPNKLTNRMQKAVAAAGLKIHVECVVAVRMLEAWLLADDTVVQQMTGSTAVYPNPENHPNPKAELSKLLRLKNVGYTREQARRIAQGADISVIEKRCGSFAKFRLAVKRL